MSFAIPQDFDARRQPLDTRVVLFTDEPAFALAQRLARRNGASSLSDFCSDMGLSHADVVQGRATARIAELAKADPVVLEGTTFVRQDRKTVRLGNEVLKSSDWSFRSLRTCPKCLEEDIEFGKGDPDYRAHVRSWWNLAFIYVCPFHNILLITYHPDDAKKTLDPEALDVRFAAGDEHDLAFAPLEKGALGAEVEKYLLGRLGFMTSVKHKSLDSLALRHAVDLMDRIGAAAVGGTFAHTNRDGTVSRREALSAGYAILSDGRAGLVRLFERIREEASAAEDEWIPKAQYGLLYAWLFHLSTRDIEGYEPIRELMLESIGSPKARLLLR
ncbi:TniQ family protein [Bradyrhizobium sp. CB1650]|uniref:TniQ family protein n=1 Tax=Bradyrhizobium sp. CB1650 TaxID=3039153 RepID=UPI002435DA26|nr:TniQ family protein [Bradyrhizobium sp. CB1650]WGD52445.1 TniQ family protein [Bradyrhizobium sp. CB1650]